MYDDDDFNHLKKKILSIKPHILDSNGVWYCSFWLERSLNPLNLKILVLDFVPRDLKWQRTSTWYLEWRHTVWEYLTIENVEALLT